MHENPTLILVGGPTASGKSAFALDLAKKRNGIIINADAMQVYKDLPILTAQPPAMAKAEIPHLLYEMTDPAEAGSVAKWLSAAEEAIAKVRARGHIPILVGGTGMYFKALIDGLAKIPEIPAAVRTASEDLYNEIGEEKFRHTLEGMDYAAAKRIAANDRQRLIRAHAVATHTGKSLSEWQKSSKPSSNDTDVEKYLLLPQREELYANCDRRFIWMMENGAIEEAKNIMGRNLSPVLPAMKILGLREIIAWLNGKMTKEEAITKAQQLTRNYAKRQTTWFRNQWNNSQNELF